MNTVELPFGLGQEFWLATGTPREVTLPCPVCEGNRWVVVILGNGERLMVDCEACGKGYDVPRGVIEEWTIYPTAERFEIAGVVSFRGAQWQVRSTANKQAEFSELHATEAEALAAAVEQAEKHEHERMMGRYYARKGTANAAWRIRYHREQIKDAEQRLAYHRARLHLPDTAEETA